MSIMMYYNISISIVLHEFLLYTLDSSNEICMDKNCVISGRYEQNVSFIKRSKFLSLLS